MKILFLTDRYPPYYEGGYELNCEITARELEGKGHQIFILTSNYGIEKPRRDSNVYRLLIGLNKSTRKGTERRIAEIKNAVYARRNYFITKDVVREVKPDVAYVWRMGSVSIFPIKAAQASGIPVVYELGDYWLLEYKLLFNEHNIFKKIYRYLIHGGIAFKGLEFKNIVTVSNLLKIRYAEQGFPENNINVIPRGIPKHYINDCPRGDQKTRTAMKLLYAGRIVREKGAHIAIEAVHHLVKHMSLKNVHLDIIGTGPKEYLDELYSIIHDRGLSDHVTFRGLMTRDFLIKAYTDYDIMLIPAIWEEPLGNTVLEAMASGLPVIASRIGGIPEMVCDGMNGLLVPPNDPSCLAEAVLKLIADEKLYLKIRTSGLSTVRQRYEQKIITGLIEECLLNSLDVRCVPVQ